MRQRNEYGLTLVEVLVSLLLLSFVTLGGMSLLTSAIRQNSLAKNRSLATSLAAERLEQLASIPMQSAADFLRYRVGNETGNAGPPPTLVADYGDIPGCPEYRRVVQLEYDTPVAGMLAVRVEVQWRDPREGLKSHVLVTYLHPDLERL